MLMMSKALWGMNPLIPSSRSRPVCWMNGHCKQQVLMSWASILWPTASLCGWSPPQILVDNPQRPTLLPSHRKASWLYFGLTSSKGIPIVESCVVVGNLWWACECEYRSIVPLLRDHTVTPILSSLSWCQERSCVTLLQLPNPFYSRERIRLHDNGSTFVKDYKASLNQNFLSIEFNDWFTQLKESWKLRWKMILSSSLSVL